MATPVDVVVIGGGSTGLHCAYFLQKSGRQVTLLDQAEIGVGSSSGNAGHIVPSHIVPLAAPGIIPTALKWLLDPANSPFGMKISLNPSYLLWLARFAAACSEANVQRGIPPLKALGLLSARLFSDIIAEEGFDCHYQQTGLLFLYKTQSAFAGGQHEAALLHQHGLPAEVLDAAAVHTREPLARPDVIGGVHFTGDAALDPGAYLAQLRARARALGADLHPNTPVTDFEVSGGKITRVLTPKAALAPRLVVLAAGAWSPRVARRLRLSLPIQPGRGYSLTLPNISPLPRQALLLGERRVAITPLGDQLRITGRMEVGVMSTIPNARWLSAIAQAAHEYLALAAASEHKAVPVWAGLRPLTPSGLPFIGYAKFIEGLIVAAGHAMLGLSLGPGTGQVVADLANKREPAFDIRPFAP